MPASLTTPTSEVRHIRRCESRGGKICVESTGPRCEIFHRTSRITRSPVLEPLDHGVQLEEAVVEEARRGLRDRLDPRPGGPDDLDLAGGHAPHPWLRIARAAMDDIAAAWQTSVRSGHGHPSRVEVGGCRVR